MATLLIAVGTALFAAYQTHQAGESTARTSYETLREASRQNTAQIEACLRGQLELRTWVEELASRFEQRQVTTEKAVARKVTSSRAPPLPPAVTLPAAPKAPPVPVVPEPTALPTFDKLEEP